ncbi:MAG: hypothetical protein NTV54_08600 [Ignavibacteriales bacterium]|nr:hypothetical protein [Ignavibacteriales bacterium]
MITSDRQCIPLWVAEAGGMRFTTQEMSLSRFSMKATNQFLEEDATLNPEDIFRQIERYLKRYVYLPDERCYAVIALWVMGTYIFRMFRYFPYIHLHAEKASGKTTLMEILEKICFNGELSSDATGVSLFHEVHTNSSTLFLDESEDLHEGQNGPKMRLLKAGFSKTGKIKRKNMTYSCYSPKMIAGIKPLDDVLADRTITIRMIRKLQSETINRYVETAEVLEFHSCLRDNLYTFGLTQARRLMSEYVRVSESPDNTLLKNRALDLWLPLIVIGSLVNEAVVAEVTQYAQAHSGQREEDDTVENETFRLLAVLGSATTDIKPIRMDGNTVYIEADMMFAYFKAIQCVPKGALRTWLSRMLHQKFDILCVPVRCPDGLKRAFEIDMTKLEEMIGRYM